MIEGVGLLQSVQGPSSSSLHESSSVQNADLSDAHIEEPTRTQAADFAHAVSTMPHVREVNAAQVPAGSGTTASVVRGLDRMVSRLDAFKIEGDRSKTTSASSPKSQPMLEGGGTDWFNGALNQMDKTFAFATEATIASHGSSEATRTLNTLLKGQ